MSQELDEAVARLAALPTPPTGDEVIQSAIRAGCSAADLHLECSYPACTCKSTPKIVRAALAAYLRLSGQR